MSRLARLAEQVVECGTTPGIAVTVVAGDRVVASASAGFGDLATADPMTADRAFNWFSMTKIATATAVMILVEGGALDLDAPVARYLGEQWPTGFSRVSVRHLLSHSGGLPNPIPLRWVHRPTDSPPAAPVLLAHVMSGRRGPRFEPGARASYSNIGYLALGEVIAAAVGRPYQDFVREELLVPLRMTRTAFSWNDPALAGVARATPYQRLPRLITPLVAAMLPAGIVGARVGKLVALQPFELDGAAYGGLIGPVGDAAQLIALHANRGSIGGHRFLTADTIDAMTAITTRGRRYDLGLGWFQPHNAPDERVCHFGGGMGYWNILRLDPRRSRAAVVMSNTTTHWDITRFADTAIETCCGPAMSTSMS
ncbi:serine hydrolase domain-containing protein [Nocardia sp. NPDC101769]|uniref:serine hydrolase domain-containing protein n=1 Tax=Nocardia sp. NPDC101769 TaxID=3364333 RepID=UPI00381B2741